ncbi:PxKF domain-containing protein [Micromonospora halotolerans]|uniref:PxKF domain-containing protein n=1 Tax=Micromonospora halotolerans TaxID=709879 RepID=A0ABY9ZUN6_9ACTN|nr:PxKF domain-containing protein [Micromonospora halotolerans]WNM39031.1 PxKF domain-containing protein [Micromonospora halotolerans]
MDEEIGTVNSIRCGVAPRTRGPLRRLRGAIAAAAVAGLVAGGMVGVATPAYAADSYTFTNTRNPILGDGSYYSADPAPVVVPAGSPGNDSGKDQLYIYTGHDQAGPSTNDFVMNEWGAFRTTDVASGQWTHFPSLARPETVFAWASPGRAYAGQMIQGVDGRYYWYLPVFERNSPAADKFAIGLAVADSPTGPWSDYVGGPLISQRAPTTNNIQNIDPTVLIDGVAPNQRVYVYWGTFGQLRMLEFGQDMKTPVGTQRSVTGLTGFFEAPWIFKRNGTYYLAYAGNNAGPTSACTPANYHACIAYATASSPTGPWTYRGTMLRPVSSTTSHPGILEFNGQWYLTYHTADAVGGGHFRRSVAIDRVEWDDTQTPPRIKLVTPTPVKGRDLSPRANIAQEAKVTVSNEPVPTQYWAKALNDEIVRSNPLPPDMWGTWTGNNPPQQWVQYTWDQPMRISGSQIDFWNDQAQGTGVGVAAPARWRIQYWNLATGQWADVPNPTGYPTSTQGFQNTTFDPVTTTQVRAIFDGSTNGSTYSAVAVEEWKILAGQPQSVTPPPMTVEVGEVDLPGAVPVAFGSETLQVPVFWDPVTPEQVASPGNFTIHGTVLGYAAERVSAPVTVISPGDTEGDVTAPTLTLTPTGSTGTAGWFRSTVRVRVSGIDDRGGRMSIGSRVDGGEPAVATDVRYTDVTVAGDGHHTVTATATDRAGNVSAAKSLAIRIDATAPVSTGTVDSATRTVRVTVSDATSGVARVEYSVDTGEWKTYTGPIEAPDWNKHTVSFRATDVAGNLETAKTVTIPADLSGPLSGNIAPVATPSASYTAGWNSVTALNDGADPTNPGQAQLWGTWSGDRPATQWVQYDWSRPVRITGTELKFWRDSNRGSGEGVAEPDGWVLQYWDEVASAWLDVTGPARYGTSTTAFNTVTFDAVTTPRVRATIRANGNGTTWSAVAITDWRVFADDPGDTVPPTTTVAWSPAEPDGGQGWYRTVPSFTLAAKDTFGVAGSQYRLDGGEWTTYPGTSVRVEQQGTHQVEFRSTDRRGNVEEPKSATVKVDTVAPTATFDSTVGLVYFGASPPALTCTAGDATSGAAGCVVSGYSTAVGTHTVTATATDVAGNTGTASQTYTVLPWTAKGFYQPVDMDGVVNTVKAGSTVPMKFELFAANEITDTSAVTMSAKAVSCSTSAGTDDIEVVASGSTALRYDTTGGQFVYNWKTPATPGACYAVTAATADGTSFTALFELR